MDFDAPGDMYAHELALAQLTAYTDAAERLADRLAELERRYERIAALADRAGVGTGAPAVSVGPAVLVGQLRLVAG